MRNTGISYSSAEKTPIILTELRELLPPLGEEQFSALEADILNNGCYVPIIVDEEFHIVDGHHRQSICAKHGLPYTMLVFSFGDMLEAKQWALDTQKNQRNLDKWELGKIALKLRPDVETRAKANQQEYHGNQYDSGLSATLPEVHTTPVDTRKELADAVGLGARTMGKVMQIDEHAPEVVKEALDKKELSVNQGYKITKQLEQLPEEEREEAAALALDMERAKREIPEKDAEADRRTRIANKFSKGFQKAILIDPSEENIRIWVECSCMTASTMEDMAKEARELETTFRTIADTLEQKIIPEDWRCAHGEDSTGSETGDARTASGASGAGLR